MHSRTNTEKACKRNVAMSLLGNEKRLRHLNTIQPACQLIETGSAWPGGFRIGIGPPFARCRQKRVELLQITRILLPDSGQIGDCNASLAKLCKRRLKFRCPAKVDPVGAHALRFTEPSTTEEFQRLWFVVADPSL